MKKSKLRYTEIKARICPICGGTLDIDIEEATAECQNCGRTFDIEISDDVRKEYIRSKERKEKKRRRPGIIQKLSPGRQLLY